MIYYSEMKVRAATLDDVAWALPQLNEFAEFYGTKKKVYPTHEKAEQIVSNMIEAHLFLIAVNDSDERVGMIAGYIMPHMFNPDMTVLSEAFWWVDQAHRNTRAGAMLLAEFLEWGKMNCDWIAMSLIKNSPVNEESLTKRGFVLYEKTYMMEVGV